MDSLCALGQTPYLMTGSLVQTLRAHFSDRDNVREPSLRDLVWSASDPSAIIIESVTRWRPAVSGQRPAVVVRRDAYSVAGIGVNDELMGYFDSGGNEYYATFLRGGHTLFCVADEAGEAERLACEVYGELIQFGPVLRRYLRLHKFKVAEVGALARLEEAAGGYAVPVSLAYAFEECWVLEPHAPKLKRIALSALLADCI